MEELPKSPGYKIIDPTKAGDGYWNFNEMSHQAEDVMYAMDVLELEIQQLHQYNWSSGHDRSQEGGLLIANMNLYYGGVGGKSLRDSALTDGCIGDGEGF